MSKPRPTKKIAAISLLFTTCAALCLTPSSAARYSDLPTSAENYGIIKQATALGLMYGMDNRRFAADQPVTRGQMAQALYNRYGTSTPQNYQFVDVAEDAWYADAIAWANQNKVMEVIGNGKFEPEATMTREQVIAVLYAFANRPTVNVNMALSNCSDFEEISEWARAPMAWAKEKGFFSEGNETTATSFYLLPQKVVNRDEFAKIIVDFVKKVEKGTSQTETGGGNYLANSMQS